MIFGRVYKHVEKKRKNKNLASTHLSGIEEPNRQRGLVCFWIQPNIRMDLISLEPKNQNRYETEWVPKFIYL